MLAYWQANASNLPAFAQMVKDVLAVPVSGVGVK
jgi:hypothetical protein